jgi:hypothetical protein
VSDHRHITTDRGLDQRSLAVVGSGLPFHPPIGVDCLGMTVSLTGEIGVYASAKSQGRSDADRGTRFVCESRSHRQPSRLLRAPTGFHRADSPITTRWRSLVTSSSGSRISRTPWCSLRHGIRSGIRQNRGQSRRDIRSLSGQTFKGAVDLIFPRVEEQALATKVRIELPYRECLLLANMCADIEIGAGEHSELEKSWM